MALRGSWASTWFTRNRARLRRRRRLPRAERRGARPLQGADHGRAGGDRRRRGDQTCGRRLRRGAGRARPWGMHHYASGTAQAVLDSAPTGARLVFSCGWHITRDDQDVFRWTLKDRALAWAGARRPCSRHRRPGRGDAAHIRQRHTLDGRTRQRPRGGREPRPSRLESARGRSDPREQHHPPHRLCPVHGRGAHEQRPDPPGTRDRRRNTIPHSGTLPDSSDRPQVAARSHCKARRSAAPRGSRKGGTSSSPRGLAHVRPLLGESSPVASVARLRTDNAARVPDGYIS